MCVCVCVCVCVLRDHERYGDESRGESSVTVSVPVCDACVPCMPCVCVDRRERGVVAAACSKHLACPGSSCSSSSSRSSSGSVCRFFGLTRGLL